MKNIWITGASRGIGLGIAKQLINGNYNLILSASSKDSFRDLPKEILTAKNTFLFPCNLLNADDVATAYEKIKASVGDIDILINNAGVCRFRDMAETTIDDFDHMMNINLRGSFLTIKQALPAMMENKSGLIVNISSTAAVHTYQKASAYSASKAAMTSMANSMREELREHGIKVVTVYPGPTDTEIWDTPVRESFAEKMMLAEDVGEAVRSVIELSENPRMQIEDIHIRPQLGDL
jgi:short-subunit dehydrogenase